MNLINLNRDLPHHNIMVQILITFLLFFFISGCSTDKVEMPEIYFVQITDTHYSEYKNKERIEKVIAEINELPMEIECVFHTGDITQEKLENDSIVNNALTLFNQFKMPVHFLPGNHDILWNNYEITKQSYIKNFGGLITYKEYKGIVFLLIYSEPLSHTLPDSSHIPLLELEAGLKQAKGKPVIVIHHTPSVDDFYRNKMHRGWKKGNKDKWVKLLNQHNVKAVIAGHFHRDEHHWLGKIPLYVSASISGHWGRQATYRIYHYKDGKIGYRTQYIQ